MIRPLVVANGLAINFLMAVAVLTAPHAHADHGAATSTCEHRGYMHIERHGGEDADRDWHHRHGQAETCVENGPREHGEPDDTEPKEPKHLPGEDEIHEHHEDTDDHHGIPRRDHEGYHCQFPYGCG